MRSPKTPPSPSIHSLAVLPFKPLVAAVLDGNIQRSGSRMRVTVRLLRTSDGRPIWASRMDENAHDLFAVQDHVADSVARALVPEEHRAERDQREDRDARGPCARWRPGR